MQKWQLMKNDIRQLIDFEKLDTLLEGFNKTTGFVTAILDLEGNVLSQSGWRQICTQFHRVNPETSKKCTISDTILANKMAEGEKYHFYKCLNGLVDVAVPIVIDGEHIANLFSGQFFFEEPDVSFFKKQAEKYGFDQEKYLAALKKVPVVSEDKVKTAMDFLLDMTLLISETTLQKQKQTELNRKINEAKVRAEESEEKFKAIVENGSVLLTLTDAQGIIEFASPQCEKVIGWKEEDIIGVSLPDFIHPDDKQRVTAEREKATSLRPIKDFEYRIIDKKNNIRWISHSATLIKKGDAFSILSTITNVTERKKTEEALKESEVKTRFILKHNPNAIAVFDNEMNVLIVSDRFLEDYDIEGKNIIGENLYEVFPELPEKWRDAHRKALHGSILTNNDDYFIRPDGSITYTRWECRPWYRSDNSIGGMIAYTEVITERKLSEIALQKSEERFNLAMKASNDGLFDWNLETNEIYYSPAWKKMLGYEDHELPNDFSIWETTTDPEDVKKSWELQQKLIAKQVDRFEMEFKMKHKNGHWVDILSRAEAIFNDSGKAVRIVGTHTDISRRKQAEEKEKELLNRFERIGLHLPGVIYQFRQRVDGSFHFPYASNGISIIYGVKPEEVDQDASKAFKAIHPDDLERVSVSINLSAQTLNPWHDVYRVNQPSGKNIWVEGNSTPQKLEDGSIIWHGYIQDITERKLAEDKLHKLSQTVEQSPASVVITDTQGHIEYVNPKFTEVTGYTAEEAIGQNPSILKSGEQSEAFYKELWETISSGKEWKGELHNKKKNGELYWEHARISPIINKNGETTNYLAVKEDVTGIKQAEMNFRHSIDQSPLGVRIVNQNGETVYANLAFLNIYDFTSLSEYLNTPAKVRYSLESYKEHLERKKIRKEGKDVADYEISIRQKNGEIKHVKVWRKEVIWNREKHFQVINLDVTEQRNLYSELLIAKEKTEENEQRLRLLYDSLSIAVLILKDGVCIECNNAALNIYHVDSKDQIIGKTPGDFSPEYQPNNIKSIEVAKSKNQIAIEKGYTSFEWLARRKNNEEFFTEVSLTKFIYKDEFYIQCLTADITERKRIENELIAAKVRAEESADKLKTANLDLKLAQKIALIGNWSFNPEVGVPVWSDEVYNIYELDLSTKPPQISEYKELYKPDTYEMFTNAIINGIGYDIELNIKVSEKKAKWIRSICLPDLKNKTSKGFLLRGTIQDITKQKETEIELLTAKEKAEESDRLKSSFLANMSHEIRTPMNGILGFLDLLQEPDLEEETKNTYIDIMGKSGQRLLNTINNIIEISKIDAKQVKIKEEQFCIVDLLQELSEFFQAEAKAKGIKLQAKLPDHTIEITSDRSMLESVFTNLIKNALKFTRSGEIVVCLEQNNGHLTAYVSDTGVGIAPEKIEHLFERFVQGSESNSTRRFEGSGLGLSITKEYVNLLNGKIWVESEVSKGSVFYVELQASELI
jgi:PAS domain S-box-containing protein